jgi:hypothetical protein
MNATQLSYLSVINTRFPVYIAYTEPGPKCPPPPRADNNASLMYALRLGPPRPAELIIHATTTCAKDEEEDGPDYIVVEMEEELSLSYRFGPTLPRSEFVLFRYTGDQEDMGYLCDNREQVLRWNGHAPTWRLVV